MEQPLLIQDLLDKERQEQQQQKHMQAMIRQTSGPESGFPNVGKTKPFKDQIPDRTCKNRTLIPVLCSLPASSELSVSVGSADFDSISDPIMKAKMVALKGINKVMSQGNLGLSPVVINRYWSHLNLSGLLVSGLTSSHPVCSQVPAGSRAPRS